MVKSNFALTKYIDKDQVYGPIWNIIRNEFELTTQLYLALNNTTSLMEGDKIGKQSIQLRDHIVLPLLTLQQYAIGKVQNKSTESPLKETYEKLLTRTMFGVINAARNAV